MTRSRTTCEIVDDLLTLMDENGVQVRGSRSIILKADDPTPNIEWPFNIVVGIMRDKEIIGTATWDGSLDWQGEAQ